MKRIPSTVQRMLIPQNYIINFWMGYLPANYKIKVWSPWKSRTPWNPWRPGARWSSRRPGVQTRRARQSLKPQPSPSKPTSGAAYIHGPTARRSPNSKSLAAVIQKKPASLLELTRKRFSCTMGSQFVDESLPFPSSPQEKVIEKDATFRHIWWSKTGQSSKKNTEMGFDYKIAPCKTIEKWS